MASPKNKTKNSETKKRSCYERLKSTGHTVSTKGSYLSKYYPKNNHPHKFEAFIASYNSAAEIETY